MDSLVYWIWLSLAATPDSATFPKLLSSFDDAKSVYESDERRIGSVIGNNASDRRALADKDLTRASEILEFCRKHNIGITAYPDPDYPMPLRNIPTPPVVLYYRGVLPDFSRGVYIASVGTRSISDYGRRMAFKFSYDLASSGATIVSGMAKGIDGVSHAAALAAGASTVAVLGNGIDICYPSGHLTLAREIVKKGCVLTEYAPKTHPTKYSFPRRNRIISGLCAATLVIEGNERSGALITARHAEAQNRTVYAVPGAAGNRNSEASNLLIKNGAKLVTCAEDIIKDFDTPKTGLLSPFGLKQSLPVDIREVLSEYKVMAVAQSDDIFTPPRAKRKPKENSFAVSESGPMPQATSPHAMAESVDSVEKEQKTDGDMLLLKHELAIYKKIPIKGSVSIDDLVDSEYNLREVMRVLLSLEMKGCVRLLPGDAVERKLS